jgi:hypothetical protein
MALSFLPMLHPLWGLALALPLAGVPVLGGALLADAALAGPVLCTTTLEAPAQAGGAPREVSRCGAVQTLPELVDRRFFTYTAPYAEGVSIRGQLRELFGIATGSINSGDSIRAFGFTDQTIVWDGTALQNTAGVLLDAQGDLLPWRTADLSNGFNGSLGAPGRGTGLGTSAGRAAGR